MFRSDLVYLRENIRALKSITEAERQLEPERAARPSPARSAARREA